MPTSTVLIAPPPKETAFLDRNGRITEPWVAWLTSITAAGTILQTVSVNQSIAEDNSTDGTAADVLDTALDSAALLASAGGSDLSVQIADAVGYATEPMRPVLPLLEEILARLALVESITGRDIPPASDAALTADPPANGWVQRCDELSAQIAAGDPAPFGALGSAAFQASTAFDAAGLAAAAQAAAQTFSSNASNLTSGTVAAARLPAPSATTLGGVQSLAAVASKWINTISTAGVPSATQPAFTDLTGTATAAQTPLAAQLAGANTFTGATQTISSSSSAPTLVLQAVGGVGIGAAFKNAAASTHFNWFVGAQQNINNGFEITPSTVADGSSFTTPVLTVATTGVSVTGTLTASGQVKALSFAIAAGANTKTGSGTLVAGTVTIANTSVTEVSKIFLQCTNTGALTSVGVLVVSAKTAATSFVVKSSNAADTSTFDFWILEN